MTYPSWEPSHRVTTNSPGRQDIFVVTLINGKLATFNAIMDYDAILAAAHGFFKEHKVPIKVLPMSGPEFFNFAGIKPSNPPEPIDPVERKTMTDRLLNIAKNTNDGDARREAFDLLTEMGVINHG